MVSTKQKFLNKKLAIVIVGYQSKSDLSACLRSIFATELLDFTVFFIDNSNDGSASYIRHNFPEVLVLKSRGNIGFASANNLVVAEAMKLGFEYIFLLNPDMVIDKNCLKKLLESTRPDTISQPLILLFDKKKTNFVNTAGNILHYLGVSYVGGYKRLRGSQQWNRDLALASGAAMLIPTAVIKQIGLFEGSFFMYHEDVDFSWRARIAGFSIQLVPEALVWHKYEFSRNKEKFFYSERNRLRFITRNYQMRTLLLIAPMLVLNEFLLVGHSLVGSWFPQKFRANLAAARRLPEDISKGKRLRRLVKDSELKSYFSSTLDFSEVKIPLVGSYNWLLRTYWDTVSKFL